MSWMVYFVSVLDGVNVLAGTAAIIAVCVAAILGIPWGINVQDAASYNRPQDTAVADRFAGVIRRLLLVAVGLGLLSALIPSSGSLIRAYMMVEGSKVINAPNAEKATAALLKRVDALIGKLDDGKKE